MGTILFILIIVFLVMWRVGVIGSKFLFFKRAKDEFWPRLWGLEERYNAQRDRSEKVADVGFDRKWLEICFEQVDDHRQKVRDILKTGGGCSDNVERLLGHIEINLDETEQFINRHESKC
ncbi:MAG: hypothetical protein Q8O87_02210 [bacterium]|nr:hypothetical protein [bacterium]